MNTMVTRSAVNEPLLTTITTSRRTIRLDLSGDRKRQLPAANTHGCQSDLPRETCWPLSGQEINHANGNSDIDGNGRSLNGQGDPLNKH